jgi:hypothetical protein
MKQHAITYRQPWISKPVTEFWFILMPPFISLLVIALFPHFFQDNKDMPDASWVILILLVDVAHVYSTLYRTYFDRSVFSQQRKLLIAIPFICFIAGVLLYSMSALWFWRILAYIAVFHFVRQQYGFMRIYSRKETGRFSKQTDKLTIYYATLYPLLYWHLSPGRNFNWFVQGDFFSFRADVLLKMLTIVYLLVLLLFIVKETMISFQQKAVNLPKLGIIAGTILSWYFGIVYFNGDMAFTLLNVVSHGIPYMALVWLHGHKKKQSYNNNPVLRMVFSSYGILIFLGIIFLLAFLEEGLWDAMVWKEHRRVFSLFSFRISFTESLLSIIVPLLAVPQLTHYIIDGYIWKIKNEEFKWRSEVTGK